jgi:hypothetical protein
MKAKSVEKLYNETGRRYSENRAAARDIVGNQRRRVIFSGCASSCAPY